MKEITIKQILVFVLAVKKYPSFPRDFRFGAFKRPTPGPYAVYGQGLDCLTWDNDAMSDAYNWKGYFCWSTGSLFLDPKFKFSKNGK